MSQYRTCNEKELLLKEGEDNNDLYLVENGELLVFGIDGTKVTPFATIGPGEFLGELSFFDKQKRSAYVMANTDCKLLIVPAHNKADYMPDWMIKMSQNVSKRLRKIDELIQQKGIRRKNAKGVKPLTIDEQREILSIVNES